MSVDQAPDSIVHRRSNTKQVHPLVGPKRVSFHEDVVEPGNGDHLIQIRIGGYGEREAPEGQEDPPRNNEALFKRSVLKSKIPKFPSLYVNGSSAVDLKSQQIVLNEIQLEMARKEWKNVRNKHLNANSNLLVDIVKKDLSLTANESVYKVSIPTHTYDFRAVMLCTWSTLNLCFTQ